MNRTLTIDETFAFPFEQKEFKSSLIIFIVGSTGNLLNIFIFIHLKFFRKNSSIFYLIIESFSNMMKLIFLFLHLNEFDDDRTILCKIRSMIDQLTTFISISMVCLSTFDQYISTNHQRHRHRHNSTRFAHRLTSIVVIISILQTIPLAVFVDFHPNFVCYVFKSIFRRYLTNFYYPILIGILPILFSFFFAFVAFRNVRRIIFRSISFRQRKFDRQLTKMIFIRTIFFDIFNAIWTFSRIYSIFHFDQHFIFTIESIFHWNFATNFFIFYFSSSRFRRQIRFILTKKLLRRWKNRIIPIAILSTSFTSINSRRRT